MKAKLVPIYFKTADDPEFSAQMQKLRELLVEEADLLQPVKLGDKLPDTDGVIFPQMLGESFRLLDKIKDLPQPLLIVTSEFGTVSMWDWEINSYLSAKGIKVIGPTNLEKAKNVCRAFALRRQLKSSKFLVYQDQPASGGGNQDEIFKRFYWWEDECINAIEAKYGIKVIKKSFKKLAQEADSISDEEVRTEWEQRAAKTPIGNLSQRAVSSAVKIYLAVKKDLDAHRDIV